ncbi:MAG TPA: S8 family serine peptidase, partial [Roseiflexaceae bacterium]|nr:S8 family serine peptidase [Roseiflexaceae bacterium]
STALIGAPAAWSNGYSGAGQTIVILDTGVDTTHPFLANKVVAEACFSNAAGVGAGVSLCPLQLPTSILAGSGVPCTINGCYHGTHVAGIAAGHTSSVAFSGVARDATLVSLQVFTQFTTGCGSKPAPCIATYRSDQLAALDYVVTLSTLYNIAAVNMSLGGNSSTTACDTDTRKVAFDLLSMLGIATVVSSGNDGTSNALSYPACISSAVSVGATRDGGVGVTPADTVANFSNSSSGLRLLAPGQTITSSVPGGGYGNLDGTSMAAPHVAGAWAVMKAQSPSASVAQILNTLRTTGVPITDARNTLSTPRIDLAKALGVTLKQPAISITDVSIGEGNSGSRMARLNVQLSASSFEDVRVAYATVNGTAIGGSDFTAASGTLLFPAGTTTQPIDVSIFGDTRDEPDEVFSLTLSNPQKATLGDGQGVITIQDDDPAPMVSIASASATKRATNHYDVSTTFDLNTVSGRTIDV